MGPEVPHKVEGSRCKSSRQAGNAKEDADKTAVKVLKKKRKKDLADHSNTANSGTPEPLKQKLESVENRDEANGVVHAESKKKIKKKIKTKRSHLQSAESSLDET